MPWMDASVWLRRIDCWADSLWDAVVFVIVDASAKTTAAEKMKKRKRAAICAAARVLDIFIALDGCIPSILQVEYETSTRTMQLAVPSV